jgi:uncharacterized protein (DUF111 family)
MQKETKEQCFFGGKIKLFSYRKIGKILEIIFFQVQIRFFFLFYMKKNRQYFHMRKLKEKKKNTAKERYVYKSLNY